MRTLARSLFFSVVFFALAVFVTAAAEPGIANQQAPAWEVTEWFQLPPGKTSLDVSDFRGKVVYVYCFQAWCPGCHSHGFPTLQQLTTHYANDSEVAFVAIQTTFEGYPFNTFAKAQETMARYGLTVPTGQSGGKHHGSALMRAYRTGGTPWTIIIDKRGVVRYNTFHVNADQAIQAIEHLKRQS